MKINGKDISAYDAKQWRVEFGNIEMKHDSEWIRGAPLPFLSGNEYGFKDFTVTLMVYGISRLDIQGKMDRILASLLDPVELDLDGYAHDFTAILEKYSIKEHSDHSRNRFQTLELQFSGYKHGDMTSVPFNGISTFEIANPGTIRSPVILELMPTIGLASVTITGICRDSRNGEDLPVTVRNLSTGKKIVLDGVKGLVTEDGTMKAADVDMWAIPSVLPGTNRVSVGTTYLNVTAKVLPLFFY